MKIFNRHSTLTTSSINIVPILDAILITLFFFLSNTQEPTLHQLTPEAIEKSKEETVTSITFIRATLGINKLKLEVPNKTFNIKPKQADIYGALEQIKELHPNIKTILLKADDSLPYEETIRAIDNFQKGHQYKVLIDYL